MNFSYSKNFVFRNFSKGFMNNKFSFNMLKTSTNSVKFCNYFSGKMYSININLLNNCNAMKVNMMSPQMMSSTAVVASDTICSEDGLVNFITGNGK